MEQKNFGKFWALFIGNNDWVIKNIFQMGKKEIFILGMSEQAWEDISGKNGQDCVWPRENLINIAKSQFPNL